MEEQRIQFCTTPDRVRIAYAVTGRGPPIVKAANWMGNLQLDAQSLWKHWYAELSRDHTLVRFDERGCGLSDREVEDLSFEACVRDLETVIDAVGLERFALFGMSQGGAVSIAYAVRHPARVSQLILHGAFARGWYKLGLPQTIIDEYEAVTTLIGVGWGRDNPTFRQIFTSSFMPDASAEQMRSFNELQRTSTTPETAMRFYRLFGGIDILDLLPRVSVPTIVFHGRDDAIVPFTYGREIASLVPGARFVPLESRNHILPQTEPAWREFVAEFRRLAPGARGAAASARAAEEAPEPDEVRALLSDLNAISLSKYRVVGRYSRYDDGTRNDLKDLKQSILGAFHSTAPMLTSYLLWAPPGSGKTFFVQQVAAHLGDRARYLEVNLAGVDEARFRTELARLDEPPSPCLCFVDEIDAKPDEPWPYEMLLPSIDRAARATSRHVLVLAGSSGSSSAGMKAKIAERRKGADLLSRIPAAHVRSIPPLSTGDRVLVAMSQVQRTAEAMDREVTEVEKMALFYLALDERLSSARQLAAFAARSVERMAPGEDRIKYDNLFDAGDPENKAFWMANQGIAKDLVNQFVRLDA